METNNFGNVFAQFILQRLQKQEVSQSIPHVVPAKKNQICLPILPISRTLNLSKLQVTCALLCDTMSESVTSNRTNDTAGRAGANEVSRQSTSLPAVPYPQQEEPSHENDTEPRQLKAAADPPGDATPNNAGNTPFKSKLSPTVRSSPTEGMTPFKSVQLKKENTVSTLNQFRATDHATIHQTVMQRKDRDPPYQLTSGDAASLSEEKYVNNTDPATGVQFTAFTSCIGIVGMKDNKMIAAHLVMMGTNDTPVDPASVGTVFSGATNMMVFGHIENWSAESNGRPLAKLSTQLAEVADWESKGNGTYKVTRAGDEWVITG
jgi:hypothetical protein